MAVLPAAGFFTNAGRTNGEAKQGQDDLVGVVRQMIGGDVPEALTIAAGVVTPTRGVVAVDTEAASASDDLTNIGTSVLPDGSLLIVQSVISSRAVVVKHAAGGAGQLLLASGADFLLSDPSMSVVFQRRGTDWREIDRSYGANLGGLRAYLGLGRGALVLRNGDLSLASGTTTVIAWGNAVYDTNGMWSAGAPSRLTVPSGVTWVRLRGQLHFDVNANGDRLVDVLKNGSTFDGMPAQATRAPASVEGRVSVTSGPIQVVAGDYFECRASQTSGGALNLRASSMTWFGMEIIR